ncbi:MAG: nitroreductase [Acidimicrobiales bacterium]|nr:nitroreductase [Acidimicrobiales bacterium]
MELAELVRQRRSIRGYREDPVPKELIREIIEIAAGAPSSMNTQPWHFHVIAGEPLERIRAENTELMMAGAPLRREIRLHRKYEGEHRDRQVEIAYQLFDAMGIREDKAMRQDWMMRGFRQFDAPVSIVATIDRSLEESTVAYLDVGAAVHALVLAAWERGLGTVINGQGISQSPVVRAHANIPEDEIIVTCVAMGWPADDFAANDVKAARLPVDRVVSFVGFDD